MSASIETAPDTEASETANPFLQFVDPMRYRELVNLADKGSTQGRLISPLSVPPAKSASSRDPRGPGEGVNRSGSRDRFWRA